MKLCCSHVDPVSTKAWNVFSDDVACFDSRSVGFAFSSGAEMVGDSFDRADHFYCISESEKHGKVFINAIN